MEEDKNGSDKNVACTEENIEGLKRLFYANALTQYGKRKLIGYYEQLIKELEEERQIVGIPVKNKRDGRIGIVLHQWKSGSVAVLESINPRVINTHDSWNTLEIVTDEVKQTQTKCETIPVSLVEEKIEELNKKLNNKGYGGCIIIPEKIMKLENQIDILQELLEKRE